MNTKLFKSDSKKRLESAYCTAYSQCCIFRCTNVTVWQHIKRGVRINALLLTVVVVVCMLMHIRHSLLFWHAYMVLEKAPAVNWISSCSFSCSYLSLSGLRLRCPAVFLCMHIKEGAHQLPKISAANKTLGGSYVLEIFFYFHTVALYTAFILWLQRRPLKIIPVKDGFIYKYNWVKDTAPLWLCIVFAQFFHFKYGDS